MPKEYSQKIQEDSKKDLTRQGLISEETPKEDTDLKKGEEAAGSKVSALHTLKSDISSYMKGENFSLAEIAAMPKQRGFEEKAVFKTSRNLFAIIGFVIIVAAGIAFGVYYFFLRENTPAETSGAGASESIIFSEKKETVSLKSDKKEELTGSIKNINELPIPLNTILAASFFLEPTKEFVTSRSFFEILKVIPPPNFTQSLDDNFTLGVYYFKKNNPFLIFKIRSSELAVSGALNWEKNMAKDLKEIFQVSLAENQNFQDKVISNRDARILYDGNNNPSVIYAFFNRQYMIMSVDLDTFNEIFRRLSIPR